MHNFIDKVEWKETEKKDYVLYFGRFSEEKTITMMITVLTPTFNRGVITKPLGFTAKANCKRV